MISDCRLLLRCVSLCFVASCWDVLSFTSRKWIVFIRGGKCLKINTVLKSGKDGNSKCSLILHTWRGTGVSVSSVARQTPVVLVKKSGQYLAFSHPLFHNAHSAITFTQQRVTVKLMSCRCAVCRLFVWTAHSGCSFCPLAACQTSKLIRCLKKCWNWLFSSFVDAFLVGAIVFPATVSQLEFPQLKAFHLKEFNSKKLLNSTTPGEWTGTAQEWWTPPQTMKTTL